MDSKEDPGSAAGKEYQDAHTAEHEPVEFQNDVQASRNLFEDLARHKKVVLYCLLFASGILLNGYDLNIVGSVTALPAFQRVYGERFGRRYIIPSTWLGLWSGMLPIGELAGSMTSAPLLDRTGRRFSLAVGVLATAIGVVISLTSKLPSEIDSRRAMFLVAKIVEGWGIGTVIVTALTYISEVVPTSLRGPGLALLSLVTIVGELVGTGVVQSQTHRLPTDSTFMVPLGTQLAFSIPPLFAVLVVPESPLWLIRRNRLQEAQKALVRLSPSSIDAKALSQQLQTVMYHESIAAEEKEPSIWKCFRGTNRRRTLLALMAYASPQFWGYTLVSTSSYFLEVLGLTPSQALMILLLTNGLGLGANIASMWTTTYFGRRTLILFSYAVNCACWLVIGIVGCFPSVKMAWATGSLLVVIMVSSGIGTLPAFYAVGGEVSSLRLRARTLSAGWWSGALFAGGFGIAWPYVYNVDSGNLKGKTGFVLAGLCLVAFVVSFLFVPEMKDKSPQEIDALFERGVSARKFGDVEEEEERKVESGGG